MEAGSADAYRQTRVWLSKETAEWVFETCETEENDRKNTETKRRALSNISAASNALSADAHCAESVGKCGRIRSYRTGSAGEWPDRREDLPDDCGRRRILQRKEPWQT